MPTGLSHKLYDKSNGPYRIVGRGQNFTYKLRRISDNKLHASMINATNLKHYYPPEDTQVWQKVRPDDIPDPEDNPADPAPPNAHPTEDPLENIQLPLPDPPDNQPPLINDDTPPPPQQEPPPPPPDKTWNFKKVLRGKMKNGVRHFRVKWLDGTTTWEPDTSFDPDVLRDLNRRFTKAGTLRKSNFKTKF